MEKKKILIVEDEKILLDLYATVLLRQGRNHVYEVEKAETVTQALDAAKRRTFDLVITDYHLPDENGIALIGKLKKIHPAAAFILISGYLSSEIQESAFAAGADTCLKKPCSIALIIETVEKALAREHGGAAEGGAGSPPTAPPPPAAAPSSVARILEGFETSAVFIDDSFRVRAFNVRFTEEYETPRHSGAVSCHELLYRSPFICPRCPIAERGDAGAPGPFLIERLNNAGIPILERIEPWPEAAGPEGQGGMVISLLPRPRTPAGDGRETAARTVAGDFFIIALDADARIVFSDDRFPRLLGLPKSGVIGRPIADFLHSYFRQYLAKQEIDFFGFAASHVDRSVTLDFIADANGARRPVLCEFVSREAGLIAPWELVIVGMNIERQIELNRLIEFERESLHRLRDGQFDMVITIDKDQRIKTINNACLTKLSAKHRDLVGANFNDLLLRPRDRQSFAQGITQAQTLKDVFHLRLDLSYCGRTCPVLVNISAVRDSFNDEIGYVLVLRDIEHQLKMEATLRNVERMQALGQLAAGTAHQINNYTNAVMGSSDILYDILQHALQDRPQERAEALDTLDIIRESIQKLTALTTHLTAFARAQQAPVISAGDVNKVVKDTLALVAAHAAKRSVTIETALDRNLPAVYFSPLHLEQAVLNILMNAVDAVEERKGRVTVSTFLRSEWICIAVADNGPGIPEEIRDHLFEAFVTTKPAGVGTGLGLNVARDVVESIKGTIEVETSPGRGTAMTIKIPIMHEGKAIER